jgi:5-methylcytosine-specific restriction enzyme A
MEDKNFGILTSIDWNSNSWKALPSTDDIKRSKFSYVEENNITHTYLNFGHNNYPCESDGYFYGLLPQLWSKTPHSKNIQVIIIKSQNWRDKKTFIIGLYLFPLFERKVLAPHIPGAPAREVNIKALVENIHLLETFIELTDSNERKFLPKGKGLGKQGFNYLTKENVLKILDEMTNQCPGDKRLNGIKFKLLKSI